MPTPPWTPSTSQHQGPPTQHHAPGTPPHNPNNPLPSTLLPTRGRGTPRHPPAPCTQGWVGGLGGHVPAVTGAGMMLPPSPRRSSLVSCLLVAYGGVPPPRNRASTQKKVTQVLPRCCRGSLIPAGTPVGGRSRGVNKHPPPAPAGVHRGAGHPAPPPPCMGDQSNQLDLASKPQLWGGGGAHLPFFFASSPPQRRGGNGWCEKIHPPPQPPNAPRLSLPGTPPGD